jgi:choline-sulfatase
MASPMAVNRREFLRAGAGAAIAPAFVRAAGRRPNILVIMSDEHNPRVAGCYGNRLARTPNLDRLAAGGVTFENAYTNSPLCVPSRLAFTAGKYIHRISAWNNDCMLPSDEYPSLPRTLNGAGYESFLCGKQHYDSTHRYGFAEIGGNMNDAAHRGRGGRRMADDERVNVDAGKTRFADFHAGEESSTMNHDRRVTSGVLDFLSRRQRADKPFFLFAGYLAPHFPITAPERYWRNYRGRIGMPEIPAGFLDDLPLNYKHLRRGFGLVEQPADVVRRGRELYYALTEWADDQIGQVLAALDRSPFARDTVVVYTSDHGENMGEHGLWWKNCMYEQASHIPLIVHWPGRWKGGQRRVGACSMVDVVRTIAEVGGARAPEDWNGQSLAGLLDDPAARWRDMAVSQYYAHNIASGYAMLRAGEWKYVFHSAPDERHPAERELYNLKGDSAELRNLARDPVHRPRMERLHAALVKELGEHPDETERRCRAECARGYDRPGIVLRGKKGAA